jgi:hypothetical protein
MHLMVTTRDRSGASTIVVLEQGAGLGLRRVRLWDRVQARLRTPALDEQLAAGASPESSVALALHAGHLCRPQQCRLLARSLNEIATSCEAPTRRRLRAPVGRHGVTRARAELAAVVDRLAAAGPVDVRGVARIRQLLADGTGPLYRESRPGHLRDELRAALRAMDPLA